MKKLLCVLMLYATANSFCQEDKFKIGFALGIEMPFALGEIDVNGVEPELDARPHIGAAANFAFSEKMGLQAELLFQGRYSSYTTIDGVNTGVEYFYLVIPIMFEFKPFKGFSLQAGPRIAVNVYDDFDGDIENIDGDFYDYDSLYGVPTAEVAIMAGPQYMAPFGLFINARFQYTVTSAFNSGSGNVAAGMFSLGWLF